jgi:hypothetical protein
LINSIIGRIFQKYSLKKIYSFLNISIATFLKFKKEYLGKKKKMNCSDKSISAKKEMKENGMKLLNIFI